MSHVICDNGQINSSHKYVCGGILVRHLIWRLSFCQRRQDYCYLTIPQIHRNFVPGQNLCIYFSQKCAYQAHFLLKYMHKFSAGTIQNPYQWKKSKKINIFSGKNHMHVLGFEGVKPGLISEKTRSVFLWWFRWWVFVGDVQFTMVCFWQVSIWVSTLQIPYLVAMLRYFSWILTSPC